MPKTLSNRLEKLENDLHVLLMLQHVSSTTESNTCSCPSAQATLPHLPKHTKRAEMYNNRSMSGINNNGTSKQETTEQIQKFEDTSVSSLPVTRETKGDSFPTSQPQDSYKSAQISKEPKKDIFMNMKFTYYPPGVSPPNKAKPCSKQKQFTKHKSDSEASKQVSDSGLTSIEATKLVEDVKRASGSKVFISPEKYESTMKELQAQQDKCEQMEQTVDKLRSVLESNRVAIQDMIQSKKLALDMAKKLREKYETMRTARKETLMQLEKLKLENSKLNSKLQQEVSTRNNLNMQLEILQVEIRSSSNSKSEAEQALSSVQADNAILQNRIAEMETRARDAEKRLHDQEAQFRKELKRRISLDNPEIQAFLKNQSQSFQIAMDDQTKAYQSTLEEKTKYVSELQCRCTVLENKLKAAQDDDDKKCSEAEAEFRKVKAMMEEKEELLQTEREQLEQIVHELTDMVKQNKNRVGELTSINKQQEALIQSQTNVISSKEEQVILASKEVEVMSHQILEFENQIIQLRRSVEAYDQMKENWTKRTLQHEDEHKQYEAKKEILEREVHACRCALDTEKDKLLIKDKIIEDQNATIKQLKNCLCEKTDELRRTSKEQEQTERELSQERLNKQKILNKTNQLQWRKEQLEEHVAELEEDLKHFEKGPSDHEKHREMLLSLEKQVESKQKEWELQLMLMSKEKEQAINAARFATKKLFETTSEFQKQVATQKKVQRMLTSLLSEKEAQLRKASEKIVSLNLHIESNLQKTHHMQHNFEVKLLRARDAVSEIINDVSKEKILA